MASMFLWIGIGLMLVSLVFPWGLKHVVEDSAPGGQTAHYRLTGLELVADDAGDGQRAGYFEPYTRLNEDHNLPGPRPLQDLDAILGVAVAGMLVAAMAHGIRPGTRRRRVGSWLFAVAASLYFAATLVSASVMAWHAQGWHAREVGPFIPWAGMWLSILALVACYRAIMLMELLPQAAVVGMPTLPPVDTD